MRKSSYKRCRGMGLTGQQKTAKEMITALLRKIFEFSDL